MKFKGQRSLLRIIKTLDICKNRIILCVSEKIKFLTTIRKEVTMLDPRNPQTIYIPDWTEREEEPREDFDSQEHYDSYQEDRDEEDRYEEI